MNHLLRSVAPISEAGWALLDAEARQRLGATLAGRKLVDFGGPYGWQFSATNLGRVKPLGAWPAEEITAVQRVVLAVVEFRSDFVLPRAILDDHDRGAVDSDLKALDEAAHRIAVAENAAVFHGLDEAGISGIAEASTQTRIPLGDDIRHYPRHVAQALEGLRNAGIGGPYGLALGPHAYTAVLETTELGVGIVLDHLKEIVEGPVVWAPGVRGGVVVSQRGGDFLMECGQDLAIGYDHHDEDSVHLYFEESFVLRVATPEAAVWLTI
jgi:uncharacterized linocin/CFP29 family protein